MGTTQESVINFVGRMSYMDHDGTEGNQVFFATRKHGSVQNETPGKADFDEAYRLEILLKKCCTNIETEVAHTDEFVTLAVTIK